MRHRPSTARRDILALPAATAPLRVEWLFAIGVVGYHIVASLAFLPWFFSWTGLVLAGVGIYVFGTLGINVGYHRLLTHRAFATYKPIEYLFATLGSMAVQGPVIAWVADHRKHHAHTDEEGDPHSPHVGRGDGILGALHGLWYAHMGWLFDSHGRAEGKKYARDLVEDRGMRFISRGFLGIVLVGLLLPAGLGYLFTGTLKGALTGCSGAASFASSCSTTSRGRSTRCATSSADGASTSRITRPTCSGSRCRRSASLGTTTTTRSRALRCTGCAGGRSTRPRGSSAR